MGYYARNPNEDYNPEFESGYSEGYKAAKDEMQEVIDELVGALKEASGIFSDKYYESLEKDRDHQGATGRAYEVLRDFCRAAIRKARADA